MLRFFMPVKIPLKGQDNFNIKYWLLFLTTNYLT